METPRPRLPRVRLRSVSAPRWGKMDGVHGMELVWLISDEPPWETEDLVHPAFATRIPLELSFEGAVRWKNGRVRKGGWSEIFSAVIP